MSVALAGFHLRAGWLLAILLIAGLGRCAESEIRLIGVTEVAEESFDWLAAEEEEAPLEMLDPPLTLPSDALSPPPSTLSPGFAPLEPADRELDFETADSAPDDWIGQGSRRGNFCSRLQRRFSWLHGPPLPVVSERWSERTLSVGLFVGGFWGDDLLPGRVRQGAGFNGGIRGGLDFDDYWGLEGRVTLVGAEVTNLATGANLRTGVQKFFDVDLLFYPWTTNRFRPFLLAGLGIGIFDFNNDLGVHIVNSTPIFPLGLGFKYRHDDWVAFRLDLIDTIALGAGSQFANTSNLSLNGSIEFRLGGPRKTYWPWNRRWLY